MDDYGATLATAGYLEILPDNTVSNEGIVEIRTDVDAFRFTTSGGAVSLTASVVNAARTSTSSRKSTTRRTPSSRRTTPTRRAQRDRSRPRSRRRPTRCASAASGARSARRWSYGLRLLGAYLISGTVANGAKPTASASRKISANGSAVGAVAPRNNHDANPPHLRHRLGQYRRRVCDRSGDRRGHRRERRAVEFEALRCWDDPATFQLSSRSPTAPTRS